MDLILLSSLLLFESSRLIKHEAINFIITHLLYFQLKYKVLIRFVLVFYLDSQFRKLFTKRNNQNFHRVYLCYQSLYRILYGS